MAGAAEVVLARARACFESSWWLVRPGGTRVPIIHIALTGPRRSMRASSLAAPCGSLSLLPWMISALSGHCSRRDRRSLGSSLAGRDCVGLCGRLPHSRSLVEARPFLAPVTASTPLQPFTIRRRCGILGSPPRPLTPHAPDHCEEQARNARSMIGVAVSLP